MSHAPTMLIKSNTINFGTAFLMVINQVGVMLLRRDRSSDGPGGTIPNLEAMWSTKKLFLGSSATSSPAIFETGKD